MADVMGKAWFIEVHDKDWGWKKVRQVWTTKPARWVTEAFALSAADAMLRQAPGTKLRVVERPSKEYGAVPGQHTDHLTAHDTAGVVAD